MNEKPIQFHIHYNVEDDFLSMSDFLTASKSAEKIIDNLNKQILGGELQYRLVIIPPEDGTFLKTIGIVVVTLIANAVVVPLSQDYVIGAFKGITEHRPSDYGEDHGRALRDLTVGFLSKEVEELENCIPHELNLDRAFKAKTDFYKSCQSNKDIHGIGFDRTHNFPIRRNSFKNHISKDRIRPVDSDFYIYEAVLVSPVNVDKDIKWELQDTVTKTKISAYMRDDTFKRGLLSGKYPMKQSKDNDILKILVEYKKQKRNGEVEVKEVCIETVYSFNNIEITPIPSSLPKGTKFQSPKETPMDRIWGAR